MSTSQGIRNTASQSQPSLQSQYVVRVYIYLLTKAFVPSHRSAHGDASANATELGGDSEIPYLMQPSK